MICSTRCTFSFAPLAEALGRGEAGASQEHDRHDHRREQDEDRIAPQESQQL
jgi:hypothetical protein